MLKDLGGESAFELIRVLRSAPKWQPAMRNGKPFAIDIKLPFTFIIKEPAGKNLDTTEKSAGNALNSQDDKIYVAVEKQPEFPGGDKGFMRYFVKHFKSTHLVEGEMNVIAAFIVNKDGSLANVEIVRLSIDNQLLKEEIHQIVSNSPKWKPAMQSGKVVRMQFTLPITLRIN